MDPASGWFLLLIIIFLGLSALFSGSETAFFSLDALKLKQIQEHETTRSKAILSLLSDPRKLIITLLVGNETVNIAATSLATAFCIKAFGNKGTGIAIGCMFLLIVIFGEITPKTVAIHHPSRFVLKTAYILNLFHKFVTPLRKVIQIIVDRLIQPFLTPRSEEDGTLTEEEFHSLVEIGQEEGILEKSQHELIKNVLEFTETTVAEVMTPREEIFSLPLEENIESALKKIKKKLNARVPVFKDNLNHIKGILYTKDLLIAQHRAKPPQTISELLRPPNFVSSDKQVVDLLREFQRTRSHMAIVVNKAGKTAGLVSLEDLLEELFGEIVGETNKTRLWRKLGPNRYLISAIMHTEDFNQRFDAQIDEEEYDTLEGVLQELYGPKPFPGEKRTYQNFEFTINRVKDKRILEIIVTDNAPPARKK